MQLDTISSKKDFEMDELKYTLSLKTYSLNDSSIVRNLSQKEGQVYLDHSHKMVSVIELSNNELIGIKQIDRTDFEDSLFPEFYTKCNLYTTEIDSVAGNKIYLASDLAVPDSDNIWRVWYSIKINDNRFGDLEIKETDYVGL